MDKSQATQSGTVDAGRSRPAGGRLAPLALVVAGLLLVSVGLYWALSGRLQRESEGYDAGAVVYGQPLKAVHETGASDPAAIPFLPRDGPQPAIFIRQNFHDFGSLGSQQVARRAFVIANRGEAPLTISRAYTTCGCTTAELSAAVIPPGKVALLTVTYDAGFHDVSGQTVRRGVILESNDPNSPQAEVWIQAAVRGGP